MSLFFVVFGVTFGVYCGCIFYGKSKWLSVVVPAIVATATTIAMYVGELILMGGKLFCFGCGLLCQPIANRPFAIIDFIVIAVSGLLTYWLMILLGKRKAVSNK